MQITFVYQENTTDVTCSQNDTVSLYSVSTDYSTDGLYTATWRHGEIEPYPACLGSDTALLARVNVQIDQAEQPVINGFLHEEVTAHATL